MNNIYNTQAEQTILGAILLDKNIIHEVESLSSDVFYNEAHKVIFNRMLELHKKGVVIDIITLIDKLKFNDELEAIGGIAYLTSLSTIVPTTSNIKYYIKIVEELQQKRNIVQASYKLIEDIRRGEDINTSLNTFETVIELKEEIKTDSTLRSIITNIFDDLNSGKKVDKLKTGIPIIDKCTNGIAKGELVTIGANSGVGKSALAIKIAINSFLKGKRILIISREMTKEQVAERIIFSYTGISKSKYENRNFNENDWQRIVRVMETFSTDDFKIDDKISTIQGIKKELRSFKPDVLIVDYVQLLTPNSSKDSRERQVAELSRELKKITIDYGIIVLQLTQLAEKGTGNYRPHGESYTRESRAIYHDSNIVIYIHNVTEEKELVQAHNKTVFKEKGSLEDMKATLERFKENGTKFIELIVDKNRSGEVGSNYYWFKGADLGYYPVI